MKNHWLILALSLSLTACVSAIKVGPGEVVVQDQLMARLDSAWNQINLPAVSKRELWTTDGITLDTLIFYTGVGDGMPLDELSGRQEKQQPIFRASMTAEEIVELYSTLVSEGGNRFTLGKLAPAMFLSGNGFRFEFTWLRKADEVEFKGVAYGAVRNGKLYLMAYRAPRIYYFGKNLARVEAVAKSLTLRAKG